MAIEQINAGSAPILWSTVDSAFRVVNQNFTTLVATIGEYGVTPIDFESLSTNIIPSTNGVYDLGATSFKWNNIHLASTIYLGNASITESGGTIQLPAGSTIGGLLLDESYFKTIAVSGQDSIVADTGTDTLTFANGSGITVTTNASSDTLTITNSGVTSVSAGTGIGVSAGTGGVTISNAGVTSVAQGAGITVSAGTGGVTISNSGIISVVTDLGSGIGLDTSVPNVVRITNTSPASSISAFKNIAVSGQDSLQADSSADTLTLVAGSGITITTNESTDSITITNDISSGYQLVNGSYDLTLLGSGALALGGGFYTNRSTSAGIECLPSVDTVVYTSISDASTIKVIMQFEGPEDGGDGNYHTHSCDIIAVKRTGPLGTVTVDATVYGGVYTSAAALATFDAQWNIVDSTIEIIARPVSVTNGGWAKLHATEIEFGGTP